MKVNGTPVIWSIFDKKTRSAVSVAMLIQFEFDSAVLTDESKERFDAVGNMLKLDISNERGLVVEGHTDNIGQKDYNLKLSFKRAESVKRYLMLNHEADSNRLIINGKGESELLDPGSPADPESSVHCRVIVCSQRGYSGEIR